MIVKSKYQKTKNLILRVVFVTILALDIIILYPQNQTASIVFGTMILLMILFLKETQIRIEIDHIVFSSSTLWGLVKNKKRLDFEYISKAHFFPEETNWLIVLLPGAGGLRNAELIFHLKNGEKISKQIIEPNEVISTLKTELGNKIPLEVN